ncbi:MAG: sigma-54-dependent Fis family transcriptional regulator [Spirochaetales bacterium]|nr:sigma-54-dependent Fis family transcriptional regulator [Spirochaetales bacterium]
MDSGVTGTESSFSIMVVDNEKLVVQSLVNMLEMKGYEVYPFFSGTEALNALSHERASVDLIITDINMPSMDGYTLIEKIRSAGFSDKKILVLTGYGSIDSAVRAIKLGADGYFEKDREPELLLFEIKKMVKQIELQRKMLSLQKQINTRNMYLFSSKNASVRRTFESAEKIAPRDVNVLICGESGTGKEILARFIHQHSRRSNKGFVSVNCSAIPDTLFESAMFGHVKGAFTGAETDTPGFFDQAHGGTLMLDEIGEMPPQNQAKLLKVIEEMTFFPVGSTKNRHADCRIISATNKDLFEQVQNKEFRSDFLYRINTVFLELIPLRKRKEDIPDLVDLFIQFYSRKYQTDAYPLEDDARELLLSYNWPGNIRELKQVIERCILFANNDRIDKQVVITHGLGKQPRSTDGLYQNLKKPYKEAKHDFERLYFQSLLEAEHHNVHNVSRISEMNRTYIYQKIKELGLDIHSPDNEYPAQ